MTKLTNSKTGGGNKAFTLIELLAVIVILAVLAVVATISITGIIETAKIVAAQNNIYEVLDAINLTILDEIIEKDNIESGQYSLNEDKIIKDGNEYPVYYNGTKIKDSTLIIEDNVIVSGCFKVNGYSMYYDGEGITNDECEPKETLKNTLSTLPLKKVNINGHEVNKVYGVVNDKENARTSLNNYVWYSGNLWQVMEVNDDTIKLITSMPITSIAYGKNSNYETSWVRKWLDEVFYKNLTRTDLIVPTKYCLDTVEATNMVEVNEIKNGTKITKILPLLRIEGTHNKISSCQNELSGNVGLMSFEDYVYAYDGKNADYINASYLSGEELEWTLSPYETNNMWVTWYYNKIQHIATADNYTNPKSYGFGVRPVISIKASALVDRGTGKNNDPYILTSEEKVNENSSITNVKVGDYIYLDESGREYNKTYNEYLTRDVNYETTKEKVRYRVVNKNSDGSVKVQRADILRNLPDTIAIRDKMYVPYYYKEGTSNADGCRYVGEDDKGNSIYYTGACEYNNYFKPTQGTEDYKYTESENIGYYLNNATNSYYNWFSAKTKDKIQTSEWNLVTTEYGKDYSKLDSNSGEEITYPTTTNDGEIEVNVGLPSWGEMYTGNDLNRSYWYINRYQGNKASVGRVYCHGDANGINVGFQWVAVRPVLNLKSSTLILEGSGTMTEPYVLD